jgi:hypothetical protein
VVCLVRSMSRSIMLDKGLSIDSIVSFMILEVFLAFCVLNFLILVTESGALLLEVSGIFVDFFALVKVGPAFSFLNSLHAQLLDIPDNWRTMDSWDADGNHDEGMVANEFNER